MKITTSRKNLSIVAAALLTAINVAALVHAVTLPTVNSGTITVTGTPGFIVSNATLNNVSCTISGGGSIVTCANSSLAGGTTVSLVLAMVNTASVTQAIPAPVVTYSSSGTSTSAFLTLTTSPSNPLPLNIGAGLTQNITFFIQGSTTNQGTDSFTLAP